MNAEDIQNVANAAGGVARTATKYPWGTMVVIAIATTAPVCRITLPLLQSCNEKYDRLVILLLEKNNIIQHHASVIQHQQDTIHIQRTVMLEADSSMAEVTKKHYQRH